MGQHSAPRNDLTPEKRNAIYGLVVVIAGALIPAGAIFGIVIDEAVPAGIISIAGGILLGGTGILAKRNVNLT